MAHDSHPEPAGAQPRSAGLAFVLGLIFGGVAFFYVLPPLQALPRALVAYALVLLSGGILWAPVFLVVAFLAAHRAKLSESRMAFDGTDVRATVGDAFHESRQTPPQAYVRPRR